jgi:anaerobic selenocysteine-containing dehydrogenase
MSADHPIRTVYRACNLCEAICGLEFKIVGERIVSIRGDDADPFSRGHICPKAVALKDIHDDPDRLRQPMKRVGEAWQEISWDEAIALAADRLAAISNTHGNNAVGFYAGNPSVHNVGTLLSVPMLSRVLKTKSAFSATSVDQLPQQLVSYLMFGHQFLIPIPDIDHTQHMLILGANPIASNGSMMTVPDVARRLKAVRQRGGKIVLVDPRRTETAEVADQHHFIVPGSDAALLMAIINIIHREGLARIRHAEQLKGLDAALAAISHVDAQAASKATGIAAGDIVRMAREFAAASSAVCYGRIGTTLQVYGALCQWLIQLLNIITGNLDSVGGALPTQPIVPITGPGTRPGHFAAWRSRVSGLPEFSGELPSAALAEEILTPGEGRVRAMVTVCGNPVLSTPNGRQLDTALAGLEFMVSIDIYLNETTRHAHLILPPASSLNHDHYDVVFNAFAVRNVTRFNAGIWPRAESERYDWEIFTALAAALAPKVNREVTPLPAPALMIGGMLKLAGSRLGMKDLAAASHGIDLGPLAPSLFNRLETADKVVDCAPAVIVADIARFNRDLLGKAAGTALRLIGRRHVRSNNSWMHNAHRLVKGKPRHQLQMHPTDLAARNLSDGQLVEVRSRIGSITVAVQSTDEVMPGVACLPHGWGHDRHGTRLGIARQHAGASYNDLSDERLIDAVSGNAAMNGIEITVHPAPKEVPATLAAD